MSDVVQLIISITGALLGAAVGFAAAYTVFYFYEEAIGNPVLSLLIAVVLGGGFFVLGGWLGLLVGKGLARNRRDKARKRRTTERFGSRPRNKR